MNDSTTPQCLVNGRSIHRSLCVATRLESQAAALLQALQPHLACTWAHILARSLDVISWRLGFEHSVVGWRNPSSLTQPASGLTTEISLLRVLTFHLSFIPHSLKARKGFP